ncbi:MAG: NAD-dependent deacylase [Firmicutes bacterium]|nr:NAD-dependent deacylase [Bacillota bacterium]
MADMLRESKSTVVFTGAGMSTESGLPDFRSAQGLWRGHDPRRIASIDAFHSNKEDFYPFYRQRIKSMLEVQPNPGHHLLAKWERMGTVRGIITQNVDRLHRAAGSLQVVELHGNLHESRCSRCGAVHSSKLMLEQENCPLCEGYLRPAVVLFGETLDEGNLDSADALSRAADLFIVLGSSLEVSPANWYPRQAKLGGAKLIIINRDPTQLDHLADLVIHGSIGECLVRADEFLAIPGN